MNRFLEDLTIGERRTGDSFHLTEADSIEFARRWDPQPMHTDPQAAEHGPLGGLSASGWQTTAIAMRLIVEMRMFGDVQVLGLGVDEVRWPKPVRPGDTLTLESEVVSVTASKSKPTHGVVRTKMTLRNQHGDVVLSMFPNTWVPRRPAP